MRARTISLALVLTAGCGTAPPVEHGPDGPFRFEISYPPELASGPLDGRVLLFITPAAPTAAGAEAPASPLVEPDMFSVEPEEAEPRFRSSDHADSAQVFGVDVTALAPGSAAVVDGTTFGYPLERLSLLPPGDYDVQALLNVYETFRRGDGHVVQLPMDHGEGQHFNRKPGNLVSRPMRVHLDPHQRRAIRVRLTEKLPPIPSPPDTELVKHVRIESKLLSRFWGRPMHLGAIVLLPPGWASHPQARYPLVVRHWHFVGDFALPVELVAAPPSSDLGGYDRARAEAGHRFYTEWTSGKLPHVVLAIIQDPTPYFDDSYAVNSANVGPYGDAVVEELVPFVEERFHAIGQPWARAVFGHSTGGWSSAALQIFYPDFWNGAWSFCPDPLDFRAFQIVDIYHDENALWERGPFGRTPRPGERKTDGSIVATMESQIHRELVFGTRGRSAEQWNVWQAEFGPVGPDGYPRPIWDPRTGAIDREVAAYWREHYDLRHILERDWARLGPKLVGKLHFWAGTRDNFYLDNGVRLLQAFMETTKDPHYVAEFHYGPHKPHCYFGDPDVSVTLDQLAYVPRTLNEIVRHMERTAPRGADLTSWKY